MSSNHNCQFVLERLNVPDTIVFDKPGHTYTCGRGKENQIICLSLTVSRRHCIFIQNQNELFVTDLKSANGLFINGIAQEPFRTTRLHPNDVIGVGCPDIDVQDNTMFAYKLRIITQPQTEESNHSGNGFPESSLNASSTIECTSDNKFDALIKRKREQENHDVIVIPNKILKVDDEFLENKPLIGTHKAVNDNDIEIVHVSVNSNILKQSNNNCDNVKKSSDSNNKLDINKSVSTDTFERSYSTKGTAQFESSRNCKIKSNELVNSEEPLLILNSVNNNIKNKRNFIVDNKNIKQLSKNTSEEAQKSTGNNFSNIGNHKNLVNSHNSNNHQPEIKMEDNNRKVTTDIETTNSVLKQNLNHCSNTYDLNEVKDTKTKDILLPPNFTQNEDAIIKLEDELQLTDTDEGADWNSSNMNFIPVVSPIKLRKVQQEPKTKFSEVDVVNLSDSEDDVFPCSQLFDIEFGTDALVKQEIKEELTEPDNERFNRLDDADLVISLSDSEDEDNTWLHRLSRSQLSNENDESNANNTDHIKKEVKDVEIIDIEKPSCVLDTIEDKLQSNISIKDNAEEGKEIEKCTHQEQEGEKGTLIQDTRKTNEMHSSDSSIERMEINSEDYVTNLMEVSSDNTVSNKKSILQKKQNLLSKEQESVNHVTTSFVSSAIERTINFSKKKSLEKKVPQIEPPHLSIRRRSHSSTRTQNVPDKPLKQRLSAKEKKELKEKEKLEQYMRAKEQKNRKTLHKWADCLPTTKRKASTSLTKEEKKELADNRKLKLKKIAMEEKRSSAQNNNQEKKRTSTKPKAKVSAKTRFDFLVEDTLSASKPEETIEKTKTLSNQSTTTNNNTLLGHEKNKDPSKDIAFRLQNSLTLNSFSSIGRIPKKSNTTKEKTSTPMQTESEDSTLSKAMKGEQHINKKEIELNSKSVLKSSVSSSSSKLNVLSTQKPKKRVSFSATIKTVHEYEIDATNVLRKLQGKDAPLPSTKKPEITGSTKMQEFLLRIFLWNPVWLEEQERLDKTPPVVREDELQVMLTRFKTYDDYYNITAPLLLLEIWYGITKEFQNINQNFRKRTFMCSIVENSIQVNMISTSLMLEVLVTKEDLQKQAHPIFGDLVFFEYVKNNARGQTFHKVFAYVTNMHQTPLTPMTRYNKDLGHYIKNPHTLITYCMLTKPLEQNIPVGRVQRLRAITYLRSNLRMVQALEYLPNSPIVNLILNPRVDMYHLPSISQPELLVTKDKLNEKQLEAVFKVTETVIKKKPKLCFIQGPPGTGKSTVIVNIITQILYGNQRYTVNGGPLRILVCAPSNAAIDEITLRLLQIRSTIKHHRFKMVRIGRLDMMHPSVKDISVTVLAQREVKKTTTISNNTPLDSVEEEKSLLESKMNALKCEMNTRNLDDTYRKHLKMKLMDIAAKYELLKNRRPLNEMNSKCNAKMQRAAENRVLVHADIITCTLSSCYNNQMESIFGFNKGRISVCIVDEATQSCEAETLIPLMLGVTTLVLVGDPNQLPATVLSPQAKQLGLDQSIFSRIQNAFEHNQNNPIIMLDTQYRMTHDIALWPNNFFYGRKLKTAAIHNEEFPFHSYRILNINTSQSNDTFSNADEAEFVANMIFCMLTNTNLDKWECISFGILTPYNNQKSVIHKKITDKLLLLPENISKKMKFDVNTVDGFQGQERDVIIMSCVRSQRIGFLSDRQRLCVALTRAKHSLILCGNFNVFMKDEMWKDLLLDAFRRKVYFNVKANANSQEIKVHVIKGATKR